MAEDEVGDALKRRVESEIKDIRERMEGEMKERLKKIESEFNQAYRVKILVVLAGVVALMVAGAITSTTTATRRANEAVIDFQNSIIARQRATIETEDSVTLLLEKVTDARDKVSKAESDLAIATDKLKHAEEKITAAEQGMATTTSTLKKAKEEYEALASKLSAGR